MSKVIVSGIVEVVVAKEIPPDRFENTYRISVKMDNGQFYGFGSGKKPALNVKSGSGWAQVEKGDQIEFVAEQNGNFWNASKKTLEIKQKGAGSSGNGVRGGSSSSGGNVGSTGASRPAGVGGDDRQDAIMRQNALSHGTAVAVAVLGSTDVDKVAQEAVRLAEEYFFQYAKNGTNPAVKKNQRNEEQQNEQASRQADEEFDDDLDIPF